MSLFLINKKYHSIKAHSPKILASKIQGSKFNFLYLVVFVTFVIFTDAFAQNLKPKSTNKIKGIVIDSENSETLKKVTISVMNTKIGTFSNLNGEFNLKVPTKLEYIDSTKFDNDSISLRFSMIGYETLIKKIFLEAYQKDSIHIIKLKTAILETEEAFVYAEDPAVRLMRKVIAKKIEQQNKLNSYSYTLYTKFVASTDTSTAGRRDSEQDTTINSILESYSLGYYKKNGNYFNQIIQKRQSVNIPPQANFVAFGTNINAYDDYVTILGEEVYTPFHPDAIDYYDFKILGKQKINNLKKITKIKITPKSSTRKLMDGFIYIDEDLLIPRYIEIKPNIAVRLPLDAEFNFNQDFEYIDSLFVLPSRMRIYATLSAEILWVFSPRLDILIETAAYNYKTNINLSDDIFEQKRVEIDKNADVFDEAFWEENNLVPLREEEKLAYNSIRMVRENPDSILFTNYINRLIAPITAQFQMFNRKPFTGIEDLFRFNRVSGFSLGFGLLDDLTEMNEGFFQGYYSFGLGKFLGESRISTFFDENRKSFLDIVVYDKIQRRDEQFIIPDRSISLLALLFKNDYGDYYSKKGFEISTGYGFGQLRFVRRERFDRVNKIKLYYKNELNYSLNNITNFGLFSNRDFRWNPETINGRNNNIGLELFFNYNREVRVGDLGLYFNYENSNSKYLKSSFDYQRIFTEGNIRFNLFPLWITNIKFSAGWSDGDLPAQKFFSTETAASGLAAGGVVRTMNVKEFYGDRFASLYFEQNFGELIPGIFRIPNVASFGLEFIGFTNVVYTSINQNNLKYNNILNNEFQTNYYNFTSKTDDNIFYEVGLGLNRLLIFFRLDFTVRFTQVQKPNLRVTFSTATF